MPTDQPGDPGGPEQNPGSHDRRAQENSPAPAGSLAGALAGAGPALMVFSGGVLSAIQSRANGTLSAELGAPLYASLWSFGSGLAILLLGLVVPSVRRAAGRALTALRAGDIRLWQFGGGLIGATFVLVQTQAVPVLGVALFLICIVAGQTVGGLVTDRFGVGSLSPRVLTWDRVAWAALAVGGAALAMSDRVATVEDPAGVVLPVVTAAGIGLLLAYQTAYNGMVRKVSGNFWFAALVNFALGFALLVVIALVSWGGSVPADFHLDGAPWWAYLGGALGVYFVVAGAVTVHKLGTLSVMLLMVAGQLLCALALDLAAPATRHLVTGSLVAGVLVALVAAVGATGALSNRFRRRR